MNIKQILDLSHLSLVEFCNIIGVPYRTAQDWKAEKRKCPDYVINLIIYKLIKEGYLSKDN